MPLPINALASTLREARVAKAWSQRELSQRAGLPQAHLSRIETGAVDPKLSTLQELSRLLDLEVVLVPRTALNAIEFVIREVESQQAARPIRSVAFFLARLTHRLSKTHPHEPLVARLEAVSRDIEALEPVLAQSPDAVEELERLVESMQPAARAYDFQALSRYVNRIGEMRNAFAHSRPDAERPAYSLDDDID